MAAINYRQTHAQRVREHQSQIRAMDPPRVLREGTNKTAVVNFKDLCQGMHRNPDHVMSYLLPELNTTGSLDCHQRFVVNRKLTPKTIEGALKRYADNYVICDYCKNPNTILEKEENRFRVYCKKCWTERCVT